MFLWLLLSPWLFSPPIALIYSCLLGNSSWRGLLKPALINYVVTLTSSVHKIPPSAELLLTSFRTVLSFTSPYCRLLSAINVFDEGLLLLLFFRGKKASGWVRLRFWSLLSSILPPVTGAAAGLSNLPWSSLWSHQEVLAVPWALVGDLHKQFSSSILGMLHFCA